MFVSVAKLEELVVSIVVTTLRKKYEFDLGWGAIPGPLRVHIWSYFLIIVQAGVIFPFLLRAYSTADYPVAAPAVLAEDALPLVELNRDGELSKQQHVSDYVSFPAVKSPENSECIDKETETATEETS